MRAVGWGSEQSTLLKRKRNNMEQEYSFEKYKTGDEEYPYLIDKIGYRDVEQVLSRDFGWCGCGDPEAALEYVYKYLKGYQDSREGKITWEKRDELFSSEGEMYFFLYWADDKGLMEHGTSVWSGWITKKGEEFIKDYELFVSRKQEII